MTVYSKVPISGPTQQIFYGKYNKRWNLGEASNDVTGVTFLEGMVATLKGIKKDYRRVMRKTKDGLRIYITIYYNKSDDLNDYVSCSYDLPPKNGL
jgi:hypothetical protein